MKTNFTAASIWTHRHKHTACIFPGDSPRPSLQLTALGCYKVSLYSALWPVIEIRCDSARHGYCTSLHLIMNRGPVKLVGSKKHKNPPISFYINTAASDSREIINKCQCASSPGNHNSTIRLAKWGVGMLWLSRSPTFFTLAFQCTLFHSFTQFVCFWMLSMRLHSVLSPMRFWSQRFVSPTDKEKKHLCSLHPEEHSCPMQPQDVITWPGDYAQQPTFDRLLIILCLCIFTSLVWPLLT